MTLQAGWTRARRADRHRTELLREAADRRTRLDRRLLDDGIRPDVDRGALDETVRRHNAGHEPYGA